MRLFNKKYLTATSSFHQALDVETSQCLDKTAITGNVCPIPIFYFGRFKIAHKISSRWKANRVGKRNRPCIPSNLTPTNYSQTFCKSLTAWNPIHSAEHSSSECPHSIESLKCDQIPTWFTKDNHLRSCIRYANALPAVIIFITKPSSALPIWNSMSKIRQTQRWTSNLYTDSFISW